MFTRCFERDGEIINISDYGYEWYDAEGHLLRSGLVDNMEDCVEMLLAENFVEIL